MPFELTSFQDPQLDADFLTYLIERQGAETTGRYGRLWNYFRNPLLHASGAAGRSLNANSRPYFQAQEIGLPPRITGVQRFAGGERTADLQRKEVVIENDIAWRVHTMIDFLFGRPLTFRSLAEDPELAATIELVIQALLDANGGMNLLQEFALFASVYGYVDIALRTPAGGAASFPSNPLATVPTPAAASPSATARRPGTSTDTPDHAPDSNLDQAGRQDPGGDRSSYQRQRALAAARTLQLETVEAPRVLPILAEDDYRATRYWVQCYCKHPARLAGRKRSWLPFPWRSPGASQATVEVIEILGADWWQRYENRQLVAEGANPLGRVPVVHVQNIALPGSYEGLSDVEPLIPLQDELNTRLSDRAHRVTYQSFKMYLGKGIDDFLERPVGPGQMWATHNLDASIEEFGADAGSPSEDIHIDQVRQAMDKVSGVTSVAAGLIGGNVGNLTSAAALKVVLAGLLAKNAKKRLTFGAGLERIVEMALDWLNRAGVLPTAPRDRKVEIHWPNPLPADEGEQLRNAQIKLLLGVSPQRVLSELGYDRQTLDAQ